MGIPSSSATDPHVVGRDHAGVVRAVGEDDQHFAARDLGGIPKRQQHGVVEGGVVAGHGLAKPQDGRGAVLRQRGGPARGCG